MSTPDRHFVVVGAQRCGTTYLRTLLDEHPEIVMAAPAVPEPKVFLTDEPVQRGHAWYDAAWFANAPDHLLRGEKSTSYLEVPATIGRIRAVLGDPQILVQLRNPVARAVSNWQLSTHHGLETRPLDRALADSLAGASDWAGTGDPAWDPGQTSVSPFAYLQRGRYAEQLAGWVEAFGDRLRVQFLEELVTDPTILGETFGWLGVRADIVPASLGRQINASAVRSTRLASELTIRLRGYFAQSDAELESLLGRRLPWGVEPASPGHG